MGFASFFLILKIKDDGSEPNNRTYFVPVVRRQKRTGQIKIEIIASRAHAPEEYASSEAVAAQEEGTVAAQVAQEQGAVAAQVATLE